MTRLLVTTAPFLLALACGSPPPSAPDGGTTVTVTGITPASGTTKVAPASKITIALSGAVDAASVDARSVRLFAGRTPVHGTVAYDAATHVITFSPTRPL